MQELSMLQVISHTSLSQEIIILFIFKIDVRQKGHKKDLQGLQRLVVFTFSF